MATMRLCRRCVAAAPLRAGPAAAAAAARPALVSAAASARSFATNAEQASGAHRSNAETLISKVAPIEVDGDTALCNGGGGALGHPLEYIQLNLGDVNDCKYCGLRYVRKGEAH